MTEIEKKFDKWNDPESGSEFVGNIYDVFEAGHKSNTGFEKGCCLVLAEIIRQHNEPTMALDIMNNLGYDLQKFIDAGCEKSDIEILKKEIIS